MKNETINELSNILTYRIQDILDDLSSGYAFNFNKEEKEIKKIIKEYVRNDKTE